MSITTDRILAALAVVGPVVCLCTSASADLIHYGQDDRDAWFDALPNAQSITFQEHPQEFPTVMLDRDFYEESHGVVFSTLNGAGVLQVEQGSWWELDGVGLTAAGSLGSLIMTFDEPMTAFGGDFNGIFVSFVLYWKGGLVGSGEWSISGSADFHGFISDTQFDEVRLQGHSSFLAVDDLHFAAIPVPAAWVLLVAGAVTGMRRRRG